MNYLLAAVGWAMTAVAAFLLGAVMEHSDRHHAEGTRMGIEG